ncbi:helix-turn-helix domain-containing protein [Hydrogenimonas thermophila]|uniref:HTH cro/C1-type domain-containing protein n=1 Tax=Hydrogenimonas thermophila TaxID=223786 RepID=A0A1I5LXC4_9BACT|nr:helix-turn-helix transcriptional regulator [Hydrogenimonas thermophila]SFP01925.1 hypothetical protein SAMN05216234_10464 [Hydrogenimonas thermophila]
MKEKESYKSIFTLTELADYLGVTRQAISSYKKNNPKRFELILLGYAAKKLDISYDDLKELNKLKGCIVADNKRNDYRYFYNIQELADFLEVALDTVRAYRKKDTSPYKRNELIKLGFAVYKLNVNFNDLIEFDNYKKSKDKLSK